MLGRILEAALVGQEEQNKRARVYISPPFRLINSHTHLYLRDNLSLRFLIIIPRIILKTRTSYRPTTTPTISIIEMAEFLPSIERIIVPLRPGVTVTEAALALSTVLRPVTGVKGISMGLRCNKFNDGLDIAEVLVRRSSVSFLNSYQASSTLLCLLDYHSLCTEVWAMGFLHSFVCFSSNQQPFLYIKPMSLIVIDWTTLSAHHAFASNPEDLAKLFIVFEPFLAGSPKVHDLQFASWGTPPGTPAEDLELAALFALPKVNMVTLSGVKEGVETEDIWEFLQLRGAEGKAGVANVATIESEAKSFVVVVVDGTKCISAQDWELWIAGRAEEIEFADVGFEKIEL
jgi:hypothetical protein